MQLTPDNILSVIIKEFPLLQNEELGVNSPLISTGLIDSLGLVVLIQALENDFQLKIDVSQFNLKNFETAQMLYTSLKS